MKKIIFCFLGVLLFSGCSTVVKLPDDFSGANGVSGTASQVAIQIRDSRGTEKIGVIGASPIKVKKSDMVQMAERSLTKMLSDEGISSVRVSGIDFNDQSKVSNQARAHDGLILFDLNSVRVSSIDVILDPPDYVAEGLMIFYDKNGQRVFASNVSGQKDSQAMMAKSIGNAIQNAILNSCASIRSLSEYDRWKKSVKS